MIYNYANRVKETTASTDPAEIILDGVAGANYRSFADSYDVGDTGIPVSIVSATGFAEGVYTLTDASTLTRTAAGDSAGTIGAGSKDVFVDLPASALAALVSTSDVDFSTTIPFDIPGEWYMPQQTVSAALTFTPSSTKVKGSCGSLRMIADGVADHAPDLTAFLRFGNNSVDYDNRTGIVNHFEFWYDGYDCIYSVSQVADAVPVDTTAPTAVSAAVANATPTVVNITLSEAMDQTKVPATSAITIGGHTVSDLAYSSSTVLNATVSDEFVNGEAARTVTYTQTGTDDLRDSAGNLLANFSGLAITNNVAAPDTTAPSFSSAEVADASPDVIVITFDETLAAFTPATSAFAVSGGKTVSSIARSGATISLTVDSAYVNGDTITITYTQPGSNQIQDAAGNLTASFGPSSVTNNISAGAVVPRMLALDHMDESGTTPNFAYAAASGVSGFDFNGGVSNVGLQSGVDGSFAIQNKNTGELVFGTATNTVADNFATFPQAIYNGASGYLPFASGSSGTAANTVVPDIDDILRMRRVGTSMIAEVARAATPTTFVTIFTWTGVSTGAVKFDVNVNTGASFDTLTAIGLA